MNRRIPRRSFCASVVGTVATGRAAWSATDASAAVKPFDADFGTALEALRAIRSGEVSCRELVDHVFRRIDKFNAEVNAFLTLDEETARKAAKEADELLARGGRAGTLHGLPILVKDTFETAGIRTTCGSKTLEDRVPTQDAVAVRRLRDAGAIIVGKTNVPEFAADVQTYNEIAGTAKNPWDPTRTPGGSTGGGAAALAVGFGFLELGTDIGGSIRTPASFCGIYGHKPTLNVVPMPGRGSLPPEKRSYVPDLVVAGPMARCADDLRLELEVIAGPAPLEATAYRWRMPKARRAHLADYRLGYVLDDPFCRVTPEVLDLLTKAIVQLQKAGVQLEEGWPPGVDPSDSWDTYYRLTAADSSPFETEATLGPMRAITTGPWVQSARLWLDGNAMSHKDWLSESAKRLNSRRVWQDYFKAHDAFLTPECFVPAFPHDHSKTFDERTLSTTLGMRPYGDVLKWIAIPTLTGCPATCAPVGQTKAGLPVGIQIMGPYLEDATPIDIASKMADVVGGFQPPPDFT